MLAGLEGGNGVMWMRALAISSALCLTMTQLVHAQLRPLEPLDFEMWFVSAPVRVQARVTWLEDQRASLAGVKGRLIELGDVRALVRTGRVVLEFAGTPQRWLQEEEVFAAPTGGARPPPVNRKVHDAGDYRVGTAVRLSSAFAAVIPVLRFGTRLPTTDNLVGLDRDATDFFALLGATHRHARWRFAAEAGVGINGTRLTAYEQSDVLLYSAAVAYAGVTVAPMVVVVGQEDLKARIIRGNEDLGEARAGVRIGKTRWLDVMVVRGYRNFSPSFGVLLGGGMDLKSK